MAEEKTIYAAIDLKSFYASVECMARDLDPMTTNLVVADPSRTEKTICLAVSPSLKAQGIPGRPRLFEVIEKVKQINSKRLREAVRLQKAIRNEQGRWAFSAASSDASVLAQDPSLELSYIVAPPRMQAYMDVSTRIYGIYLKYVSPEDIVPYSIDEVFINLTPYLSYFQMTAEELSMTMIRDILNTTGITATCGIGTNLYLAKVAMDIVAKHIPADKNGVRIAKLDELTYRKKLWTHEPLTDFWRIGKGYAQKLENVGLRTMGDIARCSIGGPADYYREELLYKLFGVNAELLIDHAWGWEPTTIAMIRSYEPETKCMCSGQVLSCPYDTEKARMVIREMAELQVLDLVDQGLVTDQLVLTVGYDRESLTGPRGKRYHGPIVKDAYGRSIPKHAHGTQNLPHLSSSTQELVEAALSLYDRIINPDLLVHRLTLEANHLTKENDPSYLSGFQPPPAEQLDMFTDYKKLDEERKEQADALKKEKRLQKAMLSLQKKYGKNTILKAASLQEGATAMKRNSEIGGHKA